ncbi:MAG: DUF4924 family protein [Bacteroidales bacterium]|nr:DUF4924 family protein [Bacteroidales bacterium]
MLIALQKKHDNIAEYLLYMWQLEDLLRAHDCDADKIAPLADRFRGIEGMDDEKIAAIRQWYCDLAAMMLAEGKREKGHLQININTLLDLTDLHLMLLKSEKDAIYTSAFYSTLPYIVELRSKEGTEPVGEIETCFTALYGVLLLRLHKKPIGKETEVAIAQISKFLGLLSEKYKQWKSGELKFEEEEEETDPLCP